MAVVFVSLMAGGTKVTFDEFGRGTIIRKYIVISNDQNDGPYDIAIGSSAPNDISYLSQIKLGIKIPPLLINSGTAPFLAQYNLDHGTHVTTVIGVNGTTDTCSWLLKKEITRAPEGDEGNRFVWHVTCTWAPLPFGFCGLGTGTDGTLILPQANPLNDPAIERSEYEHYNKRFDFDIFGAAIANSAGDPLNVTADDIRPVLVYTKNKGTTAEIDTLAAQYKNAINSDTFRSHAPGSLKIKVIEKGLLQERLGVHFVPMIVKMYVAEIATGSAGTTQNWQVIRADRGGQVLEGYVTGTGTGTGSAVRKIYPTVTSGTNTGQPLDYVNLNSDGTRKADGLPPGQKAFDVYYPLPFSALGLT